MFSNIEYLCALNSIREKFKRHNILMLDKNVIVLCEYYVNIIIMNVIKLNFYEIYTCRISLDQKKMCNKVDENLLCLNLQLQFG